MIHFQDFGWAFRVPRGLFGLAAAAVLTRGAVELAVEHGNAMSEVAAQLVQSGRGAEARHRDAVGTEWSIAILPGGEALGEDSHS